MKPSLQTNQSFRQTMTPQLQQAIKLLQLSTLELQQEIQQQVESNPLLEIAANEENHETPEKNIDDDFSDFQWSHLYATQNVSRQFNQSDYPYENLHCTTLNLQDHLLWQLHLSPLTDNDKIIGVTLIDATDDNGFLSLPLEDIYAPLINNLPSVSFLVCEAVRHRLLRFDPIGCVALNLAESLSIQLEQMPDATPHLNLAKKMVDEHIVLLSQHHYAKLLEIYNVSEEALSAALKLILHLNPRPGSTIQPQKSEFIIPDLYIQKVHHDWRVQLNTAILPKLSINSYYASMIHKNGNRSDGLFLRNHLQEARCFLKNIQHRQDTLLKVADYIVQFQKEFLETGEQAMRSLTLSDVAKALHLHESTISRVTTQKFIQTPRGLMELKCFFSNHMTMKNGQECSPISIRALIKQLIMNEDSKKPYSDTQIARILAQQGVTIARRTITNYRDLMGIAPFNKRKSNTTVNDITKER